MKPIPQRKLCFLTVVSVACLWTVNGPSAFATGRVETGSASWYSVRTNGGTHTASGQTLRDSAATAAHKTLPLGSKVRVTNLANGRSEVVTITDRGPYVAGRIIDVTIGTAERLGFVGRGVIPAKVESVGSSSVGGGERASRPLFSRDERDSRDSRDSREDRNWREGRGDRDDRDGREVRGTEGARRSSAWALFSGPRRSF